jgi:hypothetical protein
MLQHLSLPELTLFLFITLGIAALVVLIPSIY